MARRVHILASIRARRRYHFARRAAHAKGYNGRHGGHPAHLPHMPHSGAGRFVNKPGGFAGF